VPPISFHFADISTPYGPITPVDEKAGIDFFTLRPRRRPGVWYMPGSKQEMTGRAGRNIAINVDPQPAPAGGVETAMLIEQHDDGLAAFRVRLAPGESATGPTTVGTGGQYYLVMDGALERDGVSLPPNSLLFVEPEEDAPDLLAGSAGADVLVMQFPVKVVP
jgi:hypothetical protein